MSRWLTLGDVRLAILRVVAAAALPVLFSLLLAGSVTGALTSLAFAVWAFAPPALVERLARRRGSSAASVALRAGVAGGLAFPVALVQGWWVQAVNGRGPAAALRELGHVKPEPLLLVGLAAGAAFAGATFVVGILEEPTETKGAPTRPDPVDDFWPYHAALALAGLSLGLPVLVCYGVAAALGQLVPEAVTAAPTGRE